MQFRFFNPNLAALHGVFNRNLSFLFQHTEALLYGFQSIAETIDVNYSDVIPGLIGLIPRININNVQLADTVMFTIGVCLRIGAHVILKTVVVPFL